MSIFEELGSPEEWVQWASCAETDPDAFFPQKGDAAKEAKAICGGCAVREECFDFAVRTGQQHGIWGGANARELGSMRQRGRRVA